MPSIRRGPEIAAAQRPSDSGELERMRAEGRVALVIGNGAYEHAPALANPLNDAAGVAAALRRLGFVAKEAADLDRNAMLRALQEFSRLLEDAEVGLFFYAGHALQVRGQNYLVPVDAKLEREADLIFQAIELDDALRLLEQEARTSLVFLDACRDNPLARSLARSMGTRSQAIGRGLAPVASGAGTLIAFATQPGNVAADGRGAHSPFTAALLQQIETPGLEIGRLLARVTGTVRDQTQGGQVPWLHSSLTGDFYFLPPQPEDAEPVPVTPLAFDVVVWNAIKDSTDPKNFETFIEERPNSPLVRYALNRIAALRFPGGLQTTAMLPPEPTSEPEAPSPEALVLTPEAVERNQNLSRDHRRLVQLALSDLGHDAGAADGLFGSRTRLALAEWQRSGGYLETGYLDEKQALFLVEHGQGLNPPREAERLFQPPVHPVYRQPAFGRADSLRDCPDCPIVLYDWLRR